MTLTSTETAGHSPACIACGCVMVPFLDKMFDDRYGYPGYFDICRCPNCGQSQTTPLLRDRDLSDVYGGYYPRKNIVIKDLVNQARDPMSPATVLARQRSGTDNQGQYLVRPGMVVLDYGCGAGTSLLELAAMGADAHGIEADPNVQQVVDQLNLSIHIGMIDDAPYKEGQFDMIIMNQVIEHLPDPAEVLNKLRRLLKPGGRFALSFPNAGSLYARQFGRRWINWHIPYHLHHFNAKSMRLFFERNGWKVLSARTLTPNLWTFLQFKVAPEVPEIGKAQKTWTGNEQDVTAKLDFSQMNAITRRLRPFVMQSYPPGFPNTAVGRFNRFIDGIGQGDSFLIEIQPA